MRAIPILSALFVVLFATGAADAVGPAQRPGAAIPSYATFGAMPGDDVMAMAFIVMMEAAKSAQEDLRSIMAGVKAINDAKARQRKNLADLQRLAQGPCAGAAALRDCIRNAERKLVKMELASLDIMRAGVLATQSNVTLLSDSLRHAPEEAERVRNHLPPPARIIPPNPCRGWNVGFWKQCLVLMKTELAGNLPDASSQSQIDAQIDQLKQQLDSMSELGTMESLRLQMAMDRLSKMMSMLSNILKKISDTQQSITQNLK
jgi:hypothetical protein